MRIHFICLFRGEGMASIRSLPRVASTVFGLGEEQPFAWSFAPHFTHFLLSPEMGGKMESFFQKAGDGKD